MHKYDLPFLPATFKFQRYRGQKRSHLRRKIRARHPLSERAAAVELDLRCCSSRQFGHVFMAQLFPLPQSLVQLPPQLNLAVERRREEKGLAGLWNREEAKGGREMVGRESARQPVSQSVTHHTHTNRRATKKEREGRKEGWKEEKTF